MDRSKSTEPADLANAVLPDVLEEHLEEAEFLLGQWESASHSADHDLEELGETIERRLEAHLDALVLAGPGFADDFLNRELENEDEPRRAFVAARVILEIGDENRTESIFESAAHSRGALRENLTRALAACPPGRLAPIAVRRLAESDPDPGRALCWEVLSEWGIAPDGDLLQLLASDDPILQEAGLFSARRLGRIDCLSAVDALRASEGEIAASAARTALVLGSEEAWSDLRERAGSDDADLSSLSAIALIGRPEEHELLATHLHSGRQIEACVWLLAYAGTRRAGDLCAEMLSTDDERVRRLAADALGWISGFDLFDERFESTTPMQDESEGELPTLEDEPTVLSLDGVDGLPDIDVEAVRIAWLERREQIAPNERRILGRRESPEAIVAALRSAPLWRRHLVADELTLRTRGRAFCSTTAFSGRQSSQIRDLGGFRFDPQAIR